MVTAATFLRMPATDAGIVRVVSAWREPSLFVADPRGTAQLTAAGVEVILLREFRRRVEGDQCLPAGATLCGHDIEVDE